jgi:hypothetical protein
LATTWTQTGANRRQKAAVASRFLCVGRNTD